MAGARRASRAAAARDLGRARCHDRARRGAQRALGASRHRAARRLVARAPLRARRPLPRRDRVPRGRSRARPARRHRRQPDRGARAVGARGRASRRRDLVVGRASVSGSPICVLRADRRARRLRCRARSRTSATGSTTTCCPPPPPGLVAIHVRRGPWGRLQRTPPEAAFGLDDLASLPQALASLV